MKRIRSIQFKVFICLFVSFMVVFGFLINERYTNYRNQLYYNDYSTDFNEYIDYVNYLAGNEFISLIKETSVVSFVGAADLYVAFSYIGSNSYEFMVPYLVMAMIYIVLVLIISLLIKLLERSLNRSDRRN